MLTYSALLLASLAGIAAPLGTDTHEEGGPSQYEPTRVLSERDADRLRNLEGMTLQWIGWEERGVASVRQDQHGVWWLTGEQEGAGAAAVKVEGRIAEIGEDYFLLDGDVTIMGTPDAERFCDQTKLWRFAVTQNRKYYRLREFEWCDYLTDYVDLYFKR
ncbi:MAG: hypothetical protein AAFR88_08390 [Pseudomonadota bacterium]